MRISLKNGTISIGFILLIIFSACSTEKPTVAIIKFASHPALDELESGFIDVFSELLKNNSSLKNVRIQKYNANANPQTAKELAEVVTRSDVKLILAIATPAAQAVSNTPSSIPLLYGAVADPKGAGIIPSSRATGIQNAGFNIIDRAIEFLKAAFPESTTIGTLYNPGEQNSVFVQGLIAKSCAARNFALIQRPITDPSQVSSMTQSLVGQVNLIYSANDNTVNSSVASVVSICEISATPFILGDLSTLKKGALVAVGLEYRSMGINLANIAYELLQGKSVSLFPPQGPPDPEIWINQIVLEKLNISLPEVSLKMVTKFVR